MQINQFLQVLAVIYFGACTSIGGLETTILSAYLLVYTRYGFIAILYFLWIYIDKDTCEQGGRRLKWFNDSRIMKYLKDYFPVTLKCVDGVELDPKKNYLFCSFPHGIQCAGAITAFSTTKCGVEELFPNHLTHNLTLNLNFFIPLRREFFLSHNLCSVSKKSINYLLNKEGGGNIAVVMPGGAKEAYLARPGKYIFYYEKRKGYIKLALKAGVALVPVITFGETDLYNQPEYSGLVKWFQDKFHSLFGFALLLPYGNGILPFRKPLVVLVGKPMELPLITSPTIKDIDKVQADFKQKLIDLFEEHKHKYVENPEETKLVFV